MTKSKIITVGSSTRCTSSSYLYSNHYSTYPKIQMEGKWLLELGFSIGDKIQGEFEEDSIRISRVQAEEPETRELPTALQRSQARRGQRKAAAEEERTSKVAESKSEFTYDLSSKKVRRKNA